MTIRVAVDSFPVMSVQVYVTVYVLAVSVSTLEASEPAANVPSISSVQVAPSSVYVAPRFRATLLEPASSIVGAVVSRGVGGSSVDVICTEAVRFFPENISYMLSSVHRKFVYVPEGLETMASENGYSRGVFATK